MSRDAILSRIRAATARSAPPEAGPRSTLAPASLRSSGAEAVARFRAAAEAKGAITLALDTCNALPAALARLAADEHQPARMRMNDPVLADLPWRDAAIIVSRGAASPHDRTALSRAVAAVAETGTLMLASGPPNPTTLAFLPDTHVVVVGRAAIVGTFEEALAMLREIYGSSLPRSVNFISGPSRTGDIGGRIVKGAHGPRRLVICIIADEIRVPQRAP